MIDMKINVQNTKSMAIAKTPQTLELNFEGIKIQVKEFTHLSQTIMDDA